MIPVFPVPVGASTTEGSPSCAIRCCSGSVPAGMPVRQDALKSQQAVSSGQVVRLVSSGEGFSVSAEGRALSNAGEGQTVQARTVNGQVVSGIARLGGTVEVNF